MTPDGAKPLSETEGKIVDAAIRVFLRYGSRKASMIDIANAAGVSRQTLYDSFEGKDGLIRAAIRKVTDDNLARVRTRLEACQTLSDRLDGYFTETAVRSFEILQDAADVEDLISGHNIAGKDEIARSHERHEALVCELLSPYERQLRAADTSSRRHAHFIVTAAQGFKYAASSSNDLNDLLSSLKASTLRLIAK